MLTKGCVTKYHTPTSRFFFVFFFDEKQRYSTITPHQ